jgi:two-component system, response regulator FlrC
MSSVLVVDDEAPMREFYRRVLLAGGYLAIEARTAEEALDYLALSPDIDLVIADLNMPGHGGVWLIDEMRVRYPNVAVILVTADETVPGAVSLQQSVINYLVKPISARALLAAVTGALTIKKPDAPLPTSGTAAADPIENWLDKKLTHARGDGTDHNR